MYRNQRPKHVVLFNLPAQYGSEKILTEIYERSQNRWRVHVSEKKQNDYLCTKDLSDCVDKNGDNAQWVHACSWAPIR